jgi:hypothetical protein
MRGILDHIVKNNIAILLSTVLHLSQARNLKCSCHLLGERRYISGLRSGISRITCYASLIFASSTPTMMQKQ